LREGRQETLTAVRLGVPELLRCMLATTDFIESAFSVAESVTVHPPPRYGSAQED
jgi:hypothetical protein